MSLCGFGAIAQLVEHLLCKQKVRSSSLRGSTKGWWEFESPWSSQGLHSLAVEHNIVLNKFEKKEKGSSN